MPHLASLEGEGRHDSSGQFTLSAEEAARKLGAFQLPTPQSWLLVLVQAANRAHARGLKVSQSAAETLVEISGLPEWDWSDLKPYLGNPAGDDSFLCSLATALRALAGATEYHDFSLKMPNGMLLSWSEVGWARQVGGAFTRLARAHTTLRYLHLAEADLGLDYFAKRKTRRRELLDLDRALASDALASAVPIHCDGRVISGVHLGSPSDGMLRQAVAFLPLHLPKMTPVNFPTPSRWTPFGEWERELGERFRVPAEGLPTDLSGLALRPGSGLNARVGEVRDELARAAAELVEKADEGVTVDSSWHPFWTVVLGGTAFVGGLATGGTAIIVGMFLGGFAGFSMHTRKQRLERFDRVFDKQLKALPRQVNRAFC